MASNMQATVDSTGRGDTADVGLLNTPASKGDKGEKGEKKREASSPLLPEAALQEKKTRHESGSSTSSKSQADKYEDSINEMSVDLVTESDPDGNTQVHILSRPLLPDDIIQIATELRSMMMPEIKSVVRDAVKEATHSLTVEVQHLQVENERLRNANTDLIRRLEIVEGENDNLEQYTRRNTLRISGIPEETDEETDKIVLHLASNLGVGLSDNDIDRSHRVGVPGRVGTAPGAKRKDRDIIVKFTRYNARNKLYQKRKELRSIPVMNSVFINEDLTRKRSKLLYDARLLARAKLLKAAYSSDGKILVRDNEGSRHLIRSVSDLNKFGNVENAKKQLERRRSPQSVMPSTSDGASLVS